MKKRRAFLKTLGLSSVPLVLPTTGLTNSILPHQTNHKGKPATINFIFDGLWFSPQEYLNKLQEISQQQTIVPDFYGNGGATKQLEETFAKLTGKEKAIFLPTGTMANQLAIKLLNGNNTKVLVPENSHVFRDEADAAQEVHGKRLVPVGKGKAFFDLNDLQRTIAYYQSGEAFKSGIGTVVIESPVRRADGVAIPLTVLKEITDYCRKKGYKTHLDAARVHLASAFTGVSVAAYAKLFDTVYISLYKYLNASNGAILCGDKQVIDKVAHQIKVYGGTTFQSWDATAMALHYLKDIDKRWKTVKSRAEKVIAALNQMPEISIVKVPNGSNIFHMKLDEKLPLKQLANTLYHEQNIWLGRADKKGTIKFTVNESLLRRSPEAIADAWKQAVNQAKK